MKKIFIKDLLKEKQTSIKCWIANIRKMKNVSFLDVYDSSGEIQCVATEERTKNYKELIKLNRESCVELFGSIKNVNSVAEFYIDKFEVIAESKLILSPYPNESGFNVLDDKHSSQVIMHPTFYIRNRTLTDIYYIKSIFKRELQKYFWDRNFVEFETPTFTRQTLYDDKGAIWLERENQKVSLSRCATFHLEPALMCYEKLFTITNSHADEKVKTNRHLIEFFHMKAEMAWYSLDELINFAQDMYYKVAQETYKKCKDKMDKIVGEKEILEKLDKLNPKKHKIITYDEAVEILEKENIEFEYGKSLSARDEEVLTKYFGDNFIWVKYIPYTVEGFMFKRKPDNHYLTMTCDLIAPCGFGEILGVAEKITDYDELIESMKEKDKIDNFSRYKDYAELHKLGLPPHGGVGMGVERAVRYLLGIKHVKYIKPFAIIKNSQINH